MCEKMYRDAGYVEHIPNIFICAGYAAGGKDSCEVRKIDWIIVEKKLQAVLDNMISSFLDIWCLFAKLDDVITVVK